MFIAMNRFQVRRGCEAEFERVWRDRDTRVEALLRLPRSPGVPLTQRLVESRRGAIFKVQEIVMKDVSLRGILGILVLMGGFGLAGCSTPTPYQPLTDGQGYAEQPLEADRYRVSFTGNSLTPRETVENYLLYRAAEVTLQRGYDHFLVIDKDTERSTTYHSTVSGIGGAYGWPYGYYGHGYYPFGGVGSATAWPRDRYAAYANIVMRDGVKPADDPRAYDARAVLERLGPTIARSSAS